MPNEQIMKDLKVIFLGSPDFVQPIKEKLVKHFTLVDSLKEADLAVVAAYGKILTREQLEAPKYGCINIHPSLLPKYRGASPIQTAILNSDKTTGITIIKMDTEVDHGSIIYQDIINLSENDNFDILSKKMFSLAAEVLPAIIADFTKGKTTPVEQNHAMATYCERLTRESGYFPIDNPPTPEVLDRMIRAYYPWPGVWTIWRVKSQESRVKEKIVKFLPARNATHSVARRHAFGKADGGLAGEPEYLIQMEGKKAVSKKDFLNGYPDFPNILFPLK